MTPAVIAAIELVARWHLEVGCPFRPDSRELDLLRELITDALLLAKKDGRNAGYAKMLKRVHEVWPALPSRGDA